MTVFEAGTGFLENRKLNLPMKAGALARKMVQGRAAKKAKGRRQDSHR